MSDENKPKRRERTTLMNGRRDQPSTGENFHDSYQSGQWGTIGLNLDNVSKDLEVK